MAGRSGKSSEEGGFTPDQRFKLRMAQLASDSAYRMERMQSVASIIQATFVILALGLPVHLAVPAVVAFAGKSTQLEAGLSLGMYAGGAALVEAVVIFGMAWKFRRQNQTMRGMRARMKQLEIAAGFVEEGT